MSMINRLLRIRPEVHPDPDAAGQSVLDAKPLEATITDRDGQWHTFRLGAGDGLAYAGIRIDVLTDTRIKISHHDHNEAEHFIT